jgi:hypothetical protein
MGFDKLGTGEWDAGLFEAVASHVRSRMAVEASGFGSVLRHLQRGPFAAISAERAGLTPQQNKARMAQLKKILAGQDPGPALDQPDINGEPPRLALHGFVPGRGVWFGIQEKSLFVPQMSEGDAKAVAYYFGQDAYVWGDGSEDFYKVQPTGGGEPIVEGGIREHLDIMGFEPPAGSTRRTKYPESHHEKEVKDIRHQRYVERIEKGMEIAKHLREKGVAPPYTGQQMADASSELLHGVTPSGFPKDPGAEGSAGYSLTDGRKWMFREKGKPATPVQASREVWEDGYFFMLREGIRYVSPAWGCWTSGGLGRGLLRNADGDIQAENVDFLVPISVEVPMLSSLRLHPSR